MDGLEATLGTWSTLSGETDHFGGHLSTRTAAGRRVETPRSGLRLDHLISWLTFNSHPLVPFVAASGDTAATLASVGWKGFK
jgi:hypothetical protein